MAKARILTIFMLACVLTANAAREGCAQTPAKIDTSPAAQQKSIQDLKDFLQNDVDKTRKMCALGTAPEAISNKRTMSASDVRYAGAAGAADMCLGILAAKGADNTLIGFYKDLVTTIGGDTTSVGNLPGAIGVAAMGGHNTVAIGNGKAAKILASVSFDAGFTAAYESRSAVPGGQIDQAQLKGATEACLGNQMEIGTCYSVGYAQGAQAFHNQAASAR